MKNISMYYVKKLHLSKIILYLLNKWPLTQSLVLYFFANKLGLVGIYYYRYWVKLHWANAQSHACYKTGVLVDLFMWKNLQLVGKNILVNFRTSNHHLPREVRHWNSLQHERVCYLCNIILVINKLGTNWLFLTMYCSIIYISLLKNLFKQILCSTKYFKVLITLLSNKNKKPYI